MLTVPMVWQYQELLLRRIDGSWMEHIFGLDPDVTYQEYNEESTPLNNLKYHGQKDHLRIYGREAIKRKLIDAGFEVTLLEAYKYPLEYRKRLEIIDDLIICKKV